jgi:hypothetical protein
VYRRWLRPRRLCRRSARRRTDFCRPLGPPTSPRSSSQRHTRCALHYPGGVVRCQFSRFGRGGRAQGGCKCACLAATILRCVKPTTSPPRSAAPHHAYASRATPRSWSGFRPRMQAPAACRLSSLRSEQAETHHGGSSALKISLQEHHERLPDYAHNGRGDACGYDDGRHAHGRVLEPRRCGTLPTQMGSAAAHTRKPAAWFGAYSGLQKAPPPNLTQRQRVIAVEKRVRALMEVGDLKKKLN